MIRADFHSRSVAEAERLARDDVSVMDEREPPDPVGLDKLRRRGHPAIVDDDFRTPRPAA